MEIHDLKLFLLKIWEDEMRSDNLNFNLEIEKMQGNETKRGLNKCFIFFEESRSCSFYTCSTSVTNV